MTTGSQPRRRRNRRRVPTIQAVVEGFIQEGEALNLDFKRVTIRPNHLADTVVAMANSDGGVILVGIDDDGTVLGTEQKPGNVKNIMEKTTDYCMPVESRPKLAFLTVDNVHGLTVLIIIVDPQTQVVQNHRGTVYVRDYLPNGKPTNRHLSAEEAANMLMSRSQVTIESLPVYGATLDDIDEDKFIEFSRSRGVSSDPLQTALIDTGMATKQGVNVIPTTVGILAFGKQPTRFLERCDIDFVRFEGIEMKVGEELNVIKRATFEDALPVAINDAIEFVRSQIRERSPLVSMKFENLPEYPEPAWIEALVNAVAHRDYSVRGQPVFIRMFDDRLEVQSPGKVVAPNTLENIKSGKQSHHSRNPRLVRVLYDQGYMRRLGEG